ncbi:MAG: DUF1127 domain-containing protein [Pseudomonadota bacterium]
MPVYDLPVRRAPSAAFGRPRTRARGLLDYLDLWRQRRTLADLSPHQLRDIGLTKEAAKRESARPIWDVPGHWRL